MKIIVFSTVGQPCYRRGPTPLSEQATGGKSMDDLHDDVFAISPDIRYVAAAHGQQLKMRDVVTATWDSSGRWPSRSRGSEVEEALQARGGACVVSERHRMYRRNAQERRTVDFPEGCPDEGPEEALQR